MLCYDLIYYGYKKFPPDLFLLIFYITLIIHLIDFDIQNYVDLGQHCVCKRYHTENNSLSNTHHLVH
jgi:hypothetical protein